MRQCGECGICCHIGEVKGDDFIKQSYSPCFYLSLTPRRHRCWIYNSSKRPSECNSFHCSWLRGYGDEGDRPDKSGVMLSVNTFNGGTWILVIETCEDAVATTGKGIILDVSEKIDLPIVVVKYGSLPPNDTGDQVIVKDVLLGRCQKMVGQRRSWLSDTVGIYDLVSV